MLTSLFMLSGVQAATLYGVDVAESTTLAEQELVLNGVGIRKKGPFKVYLGALYVGSKAKTADVILQDEGAKRVQLNMLEIYLKIKLLERLLMVLEITQMIWLQFKCALMNSLTIWIK